jgi:hypothetical protein
MKTALSYAFLVVSVLALDARMAFASGATRTTIETLSSVAAVIVTGRVAGTTSAWDPEVSGIYSYVTVDVDRVLKGTLTESPLVIKQLGGVVGDEGLRVPGQARFAFGEYVLLFLEVRRRDATLLTAGLWQGKWTLTRDAADRVVAVQNHPENAMEPWVLSLDALWPAVARGSSQVELPSVAEIAVPRAPAVQPFVIDPPVRWMTPSVVVNIAGAQPGLTGGGTGEIAGALNQWNAPGSGLSLTLGQQQPTRCLLVNRSAGDILVTFGDPCGEVNPATGHAGFTWFYYVFSGGATINGTSFGRLVQATITTDDSAGVRGTLTTSSCFQTLMLHELGHAVGFTHSDDRTAIMAPTFPAPCSPRPLSLTPDDIAALFFVYPSTGTPTPAPPSAPVTNVQVSIGGAALTVTFTGSPGATSYQLDFRQGVGGPVVASVAAPGSPVSVGIPPGTFGTFNVTLTPRNAQGVGPPSSAAIFTIGGGCSAPPAPTGLTGRVVTGVATVQWTPSPGATAYIVQAGSVPRAADLFNGNVGATTTVSAAGLPPGFRAYVRVISVNACGVGAATTELLVQ